MLGVGAASDLVSGLKAGKATVRGTLFGYGMKCRELFP
jgi:hypothetical protein